MERSFPYPSINDSLRIDPRRAAVLTIDMQRMYLDAAVGTKVLPPEEAASVLVASAAFLEQCRAHEIPVVHVYVKRRPSEIAARQGQSYTSVRRAATAAAGRAEHESVPDRLEGSPQCELPASLVGENDIHVTSKKTTDSYYGTELAILLSQTIRPETVILLGINTETCVYATTFGTKVRGYQTVVASDCVGSHRGTDNTRMALELMARTIAWVMPSAEIVAKLSQQPTGTVATSLAGR